jgi:hypothetical protein
MPYYTIHYILYTIYHTQVDLQAMERAHRIGQVGVGVVELHKSPKCVFLS